LFGWVFFIYFSQWEYKRNVQKDMVLSGSTKLLKDSKLQGNV